MKIVHLVAKDSGGAYRAAERINYALKKNDDVDSEILVLNKAHKNSEVTAFFNNRMSLLLFKLYRTFKTKNLDKKGLLGIGYVANYGIPISKWKKVCEADIVHLHWVNDGMISYRELKKMTTKGIHIVWTMHDMFPFTAVCYYDNECGGYKNGCISCPLCNSKLSQDEINNIIRCKKEAYNENISFVGCSNWITNCAKSSFLCKNSEVMVIPNTIRFDIFKPISKRKAMEMLKLKKSEKKKFILFGAMSSTSDKRKGYEYLHKALCTLEHKDEYIVLVFGGKSEDIVDVGIETFNVGMIYNDNQLAALYSIADVFVAPSLQENLSNAVMESLACGTPVVAFNIGGMHDMIAHKSNGYLAVLSNIDDLKKGIEWTASHSNELSKSCVDSVRDKFSNNKVAEQYITLYKKLMMDL